MTKAPVIPASRQRDGIVEMTQVSRTRVRGVEPSQAVIVKDERSAVLIPLARAATSGASGR